MILKLCAGEALPAAPWGLLGVLGQAAPLLLLPPSAPGTCSPCVTGTLC